MSTSCAPPDAPEGAPALAEIPDLARTGLLTECAEALQKADAHRAWLLAAAQDRVSKIATLWAELETFVVVTDNIVSAAHPLARSIIEALGHEAPEFSGELLSLDGVARALPASLRAAVQGLSK